MAGRVVHSKVSGKPNPTDTTKIGGADWDADHTITGLTIGSDIQAHSANLDALASVVPGVNKVPYFTGAGTADVADLAVIAAAAPIDALAYNGMQINGGCDVSQENGASAVAIGTGALYKYCIDGWQIEKNGTSQFTVQQAASVFDGFQKEIKITVTQNDTGSSNASLNHMIEGNRFAAAAWGTPAAVPVTVGFWVKSSVAGTMNVFAWNSNYTAYVTSSVVISAANTRQFVTCTFPAQTGGTWDKANGLGCRLSIYLKADGYPFNVLGTIGNTLEITSLIVLPGAVAIPSSVAPLFLRSYGDELRMCQRYFYNGTPPARGVVQTTVLVSRLACLHPVPMRTTPTVTMLNSPGGANPGVYDGTVFPAATSINQPFCTSVIFEIDLDVPSGFTVGRAACLIQGSGSFSVDARL